MLLYCFTPYTIVLNHVEEMWINKHSRYQSSNYYWYISIWVHSMVDIKSQQLIDLNNMFDQIYTFYQITTVDCWTNYYHSWIAWWNLDKNFSKILSLINRDFEAKLALKITSMEETIIYLLWIFHEENKHTLPLTDTIKFQI